MVEITNCQKFYRSSIDLDKITGKRITHAKFGIGIILNINKRNFSVKFQDSEKLFPTDYLDNKNVFIDLDISHLDNSFIIKEAENLAAQEFKELKVKYFASSYAETSPLDYLYIVLRHIDRDEQLSRDEISYLLNACLYKTLIIYHERRYRKTKDPWELIYASAYFRKDDNPVKAIKCTDYLLENHSNHNNKIKSTILTTRGAAFRDIQNLIAAEECARKAIQHNETYHPHNLLGAIYFQKDNYGVGIQHFERALALGSKEQEQEYFMKSALKRSGPNRSEVALRLYQSNPKKYFWAKEFIYY